MLDSMQRNPRPTRAEASDVANAIFDGTDAIMLSGETAAGKYPVESVLTMSRIAERAESALNHREIYSKQVSAQKMSVTEAVCQAVSIAALELDARAIVTPTESGFTARMVSKYRPKSPIIAITPDEKVARRLTLVWGVLPINSRMPDTTDKLIETAVQEAMNTGLVRLGDTIVITAGVPVGLTGSTNLIKIHNVGELIAKGQGIGSWSATGKAVIAKTAEEANRKMTPGAVLVAPATDKSYMPAIEKAAAIITESGGITSHAAVVGLHLGIPVIVGVHQATSLIRDGMEITIYAEKGMIYSGQAKVL